MTGTPSTVRPRSRGITVWATVWRMLLIVSVGAVAFLASYGEAVQLIEPTSPAGAILLGRMFLDVVLGLVAFVLFPFRHRAPLPLAVAIVAISAVSTLACVAAALSIVSLSTRRRWREITVAAVVFSGSVIIVETVFPLAEPLVWWQLAVTIAGLTGTLVVMGMYIGGRRQLRATLLEQAAGAQREHDAHLEQARISERARLAREMHDVLAHRLSLVALHAGALEYRADLSPEQKQSTAGVVRENAHLALRELREVLGVLRDPSSPDSALATRPQRTLADLTELLDDSRRAGTPVILEIDQSMSTAIESLAPALSRNMYRIVQEGLTNARKHAPGNPVTLRLGGTDGDRIRLSLANPVIRTAAGSSAGRPLSGFGIAGLSERVRLAGGELSADFAGDVFTLRAWVPWKN